MNKKFYYINVLSLVGLVWLSMALASDSSNVISPSNNAIPSYIAPAASAVLNDNKPVVLFNDHPLVIDNGHIEGNANNTEYLADGIILTTGTCKNGGQCFDTHPNTVCPSGFSAYVTLNQYAAWQSGPTDKPYDLIARYSVCIPQAYGSGSAPPIQQITGGTAYGSPSNYYQVSYYAGDRVYSNIWARCGPVTASAAFLICVNNLPNPPDYWNPAMSFSWTLYCYPPGIDPPKFDTSCGS